MRNGITRRFRIDIETDSTIAADEVAEQASRTAFVKAVTEFVVAWGPILQQTPSLAPLAGQMLLFAVRAYPVARELESVIEQAMEQIQQMASQPKPPPQPSPDEQIKLQTAQIKGQAEQTKAQTEVFATRVKAQAETQKAALDANAAQQQHAMDMQKMTMEHANDVHSMNQEMQLIEEKAIARQAIQGMGIGQPQRPI
ncbi:hypothetical protein EOA91_19620 [Mesorhizobium sp. M1A.F.Ca.IN.022.04.1.1]|nr:hypothetical protein EOA91_19620 [Mesorhizobium sp. M1A.F.Ca.IN.022.04.1.1]